MLFEYSHKLRGAVPRPQLFKREKWGRSGFEGRLVGLENGPKKQRFGLGVIVNFNS